MGLKRRWAVVAVAWVAPLAWLAFVLDSTVSDGAVVTSPTAVLGVDRWGESLTVLDTYGATPLHPGDRIETVAGRTIEEWRSSPGVDRAPGQVLVYEITRPFDRLNRSQPVEVTLTRYPVGDAVAANRGYVVLALGLLLAGSVLLLRRTRSPVALGTLGAGAGLVAGSTAYPFGLQAVSVTSAGGIFPHAFGTGFLLLGLGALVVALWSFPRPPARLEARPGLTWLLLAVPVAAYAGWALGYAHQQPEPARLQALVGVSSLVVGATSLVVVVALVAGYLRSEVPADRVAVRLLVLALLTAALVRVVLVDLPRLLRDEPLVPWNVLAVAVLPTVLVCWLAAALGYRLLSIDSTVRQALLQVVVATLLGAVFLGSAGVITLTSDTSIGSIVAGGVVAMVLVPVALVVRRTGSRIMYGDRASPSRVVSELRRLDPATAPEDALYRTLNQLSRSLRLTYAGVEVGGPGAEESTTIAIGKRRGDATTVMLNVAGATLGRLELEVDPLRDPFGPRDRRLLEDVGNQVGTLVQAMISTRDLQQARERLVTTREEERRRLRRDLHDGMGPSLAALLMRLEVARDLISRDPEGAAALVGQLAEQMAAEIGEIRRLVDGLRPPALDQLGLVSALRHKAEEHNDAVALDGRPSTFRWTVDAADDLGALPAAAEVAAYRIALEAVNNAVRHSGGATCTVSLRRGTDALEVEIRDDGAGLGEAKRLGVGVESMRERAEELGGTCTIDPAEGGGVVVTARLPLSPPNEHGRS